MLQDCKLYYLKALMAAAFVFSAHSHAASFVINDGQIVTTPQTLNDNQTGLVQSGALLSTASTAINVVGMGVLVNNSGSIKTVGSNSNGIFIDNANVTAINNGIITSTGGFGILASVNSTNAIITNNGIISISSFGGPGLGSDSPSSIIVNNGKVSTFGDSSAGIATNFRAENYGAITTYGVGSYGLLSGGNNINVINSGSISTAGEYGYGIYSVGNNTIINSGTIITSGNDAEAIKSDNGNKIINSGNIITSGANSEGVNWSNVAITFINTGNIITSGTGASGVGSGGPSGSVINNSGSIQVTGLNAAGVITFSDTVINNSGLISATGNASHAIFAGVGNITLNLQPGSQIMGNIDLGPGNNIVNISNGTTSSSTLTFNNAGKINLLGNSPTTRSGNIVSFIDPTGQSTTGATLSTTTTSVHNMINQHLTQNIAEPVHVASNELRLGMLGESSRPQTWTRFFGSSRERASEGLSLAYDHSVYGVGGGYETATEHGRIGMLGGYARSNASTDISSIGIQSDTFFAGVYGQQDIKRWKLSAAILAGYENHDSNRKVLDNLNGMQSAKSDYGSLFISPSVLLRSAFKLQENIEFRPSVMLTYTFGIYEGYKESGTSQSNMRVGNRNADVWATRVQTALAYKLNSLSELELRVGASGRQTSSERTHATLLGNSLSYGNTSDESVFGGYLGAKLLYQLKNRINLVLDTEYESMSGNEIAVSAYLNLLYML